MTLSERAADGFVWFFGQTVATRIISFGGQVILAWLLDPTAFGIISVAYAVRGFISVFQQNGVNRILVAKHEQFAQLSTAAFWFALTTGVITSTLVILSAPFVSSFYGQPSLNGILYIFAAVAPIETLTVLPNAILQRDLSFRLMAKVNAGRVCIRTALTIIFALGGFGVYSFALPLLITAPFCAGVLWYITRPRVSIRFQFKYWTEIVQLSGFQIGTAMVRTAINQGDYLILGAFYDAHKVGIYFLAYSLSIQTATLVDNNIGNTLFATFSRINDDPQRQHVAFLRCARLLALITVPVSAYVAVCAEPLIRVLYTNKWLAAFPILQILASGMCLSVLGPLAAARLQSRARFGTLWVVQMIRLLTFLIVAAVTVRIGITWFGFAAVSPFLVGPILMTLVVSKNHGNAVRALLDPLVLPVLISVIAGILSETVIHWLPPDNWWNAVGALMAAAGIFGVTVVVLTRWIRPVVWYDVVTLGSPIAEKMCSALRSLARPVAG